MSEQRFTIQKASGMYLHLPIFDNNVEMADGDVCILLNEQQATIRKLQDLCGERDSENARLLSKRIEELEHFEECVNKAKQLQEENEQLRQKLKDIYSFKGSNCRCVKYE